MAGRKKTVLIAVSLAILSLAALRFWGGSKGASYIVLQKDRFPMVGLSSAKIEVVLFEDFRCSGCQYFDQEIYPRLSEHYIKTGKVKLIVVPLAFLKNSKILANAAWAVFEQNPKQFFPYVSGIFRLGSDEEVSAEDLIGLAAEVGGIDTEELEACIEKDCYSEILDKNLEWAREVMGNDFKTPSVYINGEKSSARSFKSIQAQIEKILVPAT